MERRNIYVAISIILIIVAFLVVTGNLQAKETGRFSFKSCTDSDTGLDYYKKGIVIYTLYGKEKEYTDYCYTRTGAREAWLNEYYCMSGDKVRSKEKYCGSLGCKDGACVSETKPECRDSDDGKNIYEKGSVCVNSKCEEDLCLDEVYVSERYCNELGEMGSSIYKCTGKCVEGKCIELITNQSS